ncbi:gamma-glutamylcyclotransferase family protein, partial [Acinetobacter baumannii]
MSKGDTFLLFVYGTLMRDGSRNRAIADQTFIREAVTKTGFQLLDLGSYPGLVRVDQDGRQVSGELWEIHNSRMSLLDQIE